MTEGLDNAAAGFNSSVMSRISALPTVTDASPSITRTSTGEFPRSWGRPADTAAPALRVYCPGETSVKTNAVRAGLAQQDVAAEKFPV
jgi:hypothetical protein